MAGALPMSRRYCLLDANLYPVRGLKAGNPAYGGIGAATVDFGNRDGSKPDVAIILLMRQAAFGGSTAFPIVP